MRIAALLLALALTSSGAAQTPVATAPPLTATFIGNEAWHITDGEYTLLTDFPYQSGYSRYMTWDASGVPKVKDPAKLLVVTTHQHRDHFAAELFPRLNPAGVIGPATVRAAAPAKGITPTADARFGPIRVQAIATPHADLEHYSYVIEWHGVRIYVPGDTEEAKSLIGAKNLDVAFVTPWMLRAAQRAGAKIDARRVIVVHHEAGQSVAPYQGSTVPRQGDVLVLQQRNSDVGPAGPDPADSTSYLPRWSPNGEQIAFYRREAGRWSIYTMKADGTALRKLKAAGGHDDFQPAWSPDGLSLAFDSNRDGNREIYVMNADGSGPRRLTDNGGRDTMPSWSPDGRQIVFVSNRGGAAELWIMDADGGNSRQLTRGSTDNDVPRPAWSPDGRSIAYASSRVAAADNPDGKRRLFLVDLSSGAPRALTGPSFDSNARWSPDSSSLVFDTNPNGVDDSSKGDWEIFAIERTGENRRRLTDNRLNDWAPDWSPDGRRIAFCSGMNDRYEIWTMNPDGTDRRRVTFFLDGTRRLNESPASP